MDDLAALVIPACSQSSPREARATRAFHSSPRIFGNFLPSRRRQYLQHVDVALAQIGQKTAPGAPGTFVAFIPTWLQPSLRKC